MSFDICFFFTVRGSKLKCSLPVASCAHQCKHWCELLKMRASSPAPKKKQTHWGLFLFYMRGCKRLEIKMPYAGGIWRQPVRKLGASRALPVADAARRARGSGRKNRGSA